MSRDEKIAWMRGWCARNGLRLDLEAECGFGRECVGVLHDGEDTAHSHYPDYEWSGANWERIDENGDVWTPPDAYHKHPCVAVLGRGEEAEGQLYDWLLYFEANDFVVEVVSRERGDSEIERLLGSVQARMVRKRTEKLKDGKT